MVQIKIYTYDGLDSLLANADVMFMDLDLGPITVKGFQIWRSQFQNKRLGGEKINIEPPSTKSDPKVAKYQFVHLDVEEMWFELMTQIYAAYKKEISKWEKPSQDSHSP